MFTQDYKNNSLNIIINFILKILWCSIGMYGITCAIAEVYNINITNIHIIIYIIVMLTGFVFLFQSSETIGFGFGIIFLLILHLHVKYAGFFSKIITGFRILKSDFIYKLNDAGFQINYNVNIDELLYTKEPITVYTEVAIISLMIFIAAIISLYAFKKHKSLFISIVIILLILPGILFEFMPSLLNFRIILSFIISLFFIEKIGNINIKKGDSEQTNKKNFKQSFLYTTYLSKYAIIVFSVSYLLAIASSYIPEKQNFISMSLFEDIAFDINILLEKSNSPLPITFNIGFKGGMSNGNLGKGGFKYSNSPIMNVYSSSKKPIYLRTWIGENYNYNRWFSFDDDEMNNYLKDFGNTFMPEQITWNFFKTLSNTNGLTQLVDDSISLNDVNIEYINMNKNLLYIPSIGIDIQQYFDKNQFRNIGEGMGLINNTFDAKKGYSINSIMPIYSSKNIEDLITYSEQIYNDVGGSEYEIDIERRYRDFVYSNYLYLPTNIFSRIEKLASYITYNENNRFQKVIAIQNYLSQNYEYNLNPPQSDNKKEDFVEYFLFDSKEGYCTYYATAMVLMLRTLGVPARYVEGYLVQGDGIMENNMCKRVVTDSNAHAWPEVYFDSVGWLPFEPTVTFTSGLFSQEDILEDTTVNFSEYKEKPNEEKLETTDIEQEETSISNEYKEEIDNKITKDNIKSYDLLIYFILVIILVILILFYVFIKHNNNRHINYDNPYIAEQHIVYIFKQLERMGLIRNSYELPTEFALRVDSKIPNIHFSNIIDIILKVRFSNNKITQYELDILKNYAEVISKILYDKSNIFKKLYYKYIS